MARNINWWHWLSVTPSLPLSEATELVDGIELYYRMGGSGPPLLLLHGFTVTGRQWDPFLDELGKRYTVIVPDLPGLGRSARPTGDFTHREAARLVFGILDALGIERVRGIGHSSGAIMLIHMAIQQPDRMEAMVLVAGAHRLPPDVRQERRAGAHRWEKLNPESLACFRQLHPGGDPQIRWVMAQMDSFGDNYVDFDVSPEHLMIIGTPTLLVWGDRDANFPVEYALEIYRALPNAALWVLPALGHVALWVSEEAQAMFPGVVHDFFEGRLVE
jgi:pimeloyl-ACP methyl ester carboxylesterase